MAPDLNLLKDPASNAPSEVSSGEAGFVNNGDFSSTDSSASVPLSTNGTTNGANGHGGRPDLKPVAICGMAMRLPGGVRSAGDFWDLLYNGRDARGPVPADRYNAAAFDDSLGGHGAIPPKMGYFLDEDLSTLDTSFFSVGKTELEKADPQQRQLLEVTRECLDSAGEVDYRGKDIGCYVGTFGEDWLYSASKETLASGGYTMTGHVDLMIANRVSYEYDLQGPSIVVKTGCSASLVALHEAFRALQSGDCSGALVAGTSLIMGPTTTAAMFSEGILSPEASCKTFDVTANGFARAEAITCVYVKLLEDAVRDGNPIRAVIRNTGTNSDGKSVGLMAPNGKAHESLMRKVYLEANLKPEDTGYVEVSFRNFFDTSWRSTSNC
jgi:acyl transferase domain-containing protein